MSEVLTPGEVDAVLGPQLVSDIAAQVRRYVVLDDDQADTVALWIMHAWTIDAFFTTGRLYINSPEPECGKTRLLRTIQYLLDDVINSPSISPPVLYRRLATGTPAFLLDEIDTNIAMKGAKDSESVAALVGILNAGYARGATVQRVNRTSMKVEEFPTFCPVALAGIDNSNLSDAFMSRTIAIDLRRKLRHEEADRWIDGPALRADFDVIRDRISTWAGLHREALRVRVIEYPEELSDRQIECWGPMIAIADEVGADWPDRARRAYLRISEGPDETAGGVGHQLLVDIRDVFEDRDWIATATLVRKLNELEDADYDTWNRGKGMTAKTLGLKLDPYRISPLRRQIEGEQTRGYARDQFHDAWTRYAPIDPHPSLFSSVRVRSGNHVEASIETLPDVATLLPDEGGEVAGSGNGQHLATEAPDVATNPPPSGNGQASPVFTAEDHELWAGEFEEEEL